MRMIQLNPDPANIRHIPRYYFRFSLSTFLIGFAQIESGDGWGQLPHLSPPHGNANVSISWSVLFALFCRSSPSCRHFKRHLLRHLSQLHHTVVGARARRIVRSLVAWSRSDSNKAVISCVNDDRVDIPQTRTCCVSTRHCTLWPLEVGKNPNPASTNTARTQVLPRTEPNRTRTQIVTVPTRFFH